MSLTNRVLSNYQRGSKHVMKFYDGCHGEKTCYGHGFIEEQPDRLKHDDADEQRDPNERENGPVPWENHKAPRNKLEGGDQAAECDEREHRVGVSNVATNGR